jgi:hypothetical protein
MNRFSSQPPRSAHDKVQEFDPGYAHVAQGDLSSIRNDEWEVEVVDSDPEMYACGRVRIDGVMHQVWWSPRDQRNVAQVLRAARAS